MPPPPLQGYERIMGTALQKVRRRAHGREHLRERRGRGWCRGASSFFVLRCFQTVNRLKVLKNDADRKAHDINASTDSPCRATFFTIETLRVRLLELR